MAISEWELWASAVAIVKQHGQRAVAHASERILALASAGDPDGMNVWLAIMDRIEQLEEKGQVRH